MDWAAIAALSGRVQEPVGTVRAPRYNPNRGDAAAWLEANSEQAVRARHKARSNFVSVQSQMIIDRVGCDECGAKLGKPCLNGETLTTPHTQRWKRFKRLHPEYASAKRQAARSSGSRKKPRRQ